MPRPRSLRAKAAGFTAIRMTQHWLPDQVEPPGGDLAALKNAVFAATANQMQVFLVVSHPGSRTTPLTEKSAQAVRAVRHRAREGAPRRPPLHDRQRAEPERLLAPAVRAERRERRRARVPRAPRRGLRRAEGGVAEHRRPRRRALPARFRQPHARAAHALADEVHPRHGNGLQGQRAHEAGDGRALDQPVPRQLEPVAGDGAPERHLDRRRGLRQARQAARPGVRRHRRRRAPRSRSTTASSGSSRSRPRARPRSTTAPSRRRRGRWTRRSRPPATARRSSSRSASPTSPASSCS